MSLSQYPLKLARVFDPVVDVDSERRYTVLEGGSEVQYFPLISTSFSNASATFSGFAPNPKTVVDRNIKLKMPVTIDFVGTSSGPGTNLLESGYDAFRAFPLSQMTEALSVSVNGNVMSVNLSDIIDPLMRYNQDHASKEFCYSTTPAMQDQYQEYADGELTVNNPLAKYGDNSYQATRGAFPMEITNHTTTTARVTSTLTENLFLSPFIWGAMREAGFIGVQDLNFTFTFSSNLSRIWSHSNAKGATLTSVTVTLGQPILLLKYITLKESAKIPKMIQYPFYKVVRYATDPNVAIAPGASTTLISANLQLQSIPKQLYVFARERNSDRTFETSDTYFGITGLTINWNNKTILNSASQQDLYDISVENGCRLSWAQWSGTTHRSEGSTDTTIGTVGSVLNLRMGKDVGLSSKEAPGQLGTYQMYMTVNVTNVNQSRAITPTLYIVAVNEGSLTIVDGNVIQEIGVLSEKDIMASKDAPIVPFSEVEQIYGGNFLDSIKNFGKKVWQGVKKYGPGVAKFALENAPKAAPLLMALGEDGEYHPYDPKMTEGGIQFAGGREMPKHQMLKRLLRK